LLHEAYLQYLLKYYKKRPNEGDGEDIFESGYVVRIEREAQESKEEHREVGNRSKHQHSMYEMM
jgi:hypothetical protein